MVALEDERADERALTGGKAAALATATRNGHRTVPGFVLTTAATARIDDGERDAVDRALDAAWRDLSDDGRRHVVVRSSSVVEDAGDESMAGRYESVADVGDAEQLHAAVDTVLDSRRPVAEHADLSPTHPIAVLVQRQVAPRWGGVAFGVEPVSGRPDRRVVVAGDGAPEGLVSGEVRGDRWVTGPGGEPTVEEPDERQTDLPDDLVSAIVRLVDDVSDLFDEPQDVEWGAEPDGTVVLLQTRPVTTEVTGVPTGPVLGTGPIAETFPDQLSALERDLWLAPLRDAIAHALSVAAVAADGDIEASPVVTDVDGRPAVDLELFGRVDRDSSPVRDRIRRIAASWRLGRLRSALPRTARRVVDRTDDALANVDELAEYSAEQLLDLLDRTRAVLQSLHGHEVLIGLLSSPGDAQITGSGVGLRALAAARRDGLDDDAAVARDPAILALSPPAVCRPLDLPSTDDLPRLRDGAPPADDPAVLREALRMRVRWVQELGARAGAELGRRLAQADLLDHPDAVRDVTWDALRRAVVDGTRPELSPTPDSAPLPSRFRLTDDGTPVPESSSDGEGTAAGGGVGTGPARIHRDGDPTDDVEPGDVLVTETLAPDLASVLPRLAGMVATTGSPLSHVAILARESGVPCVVGMAGALERFEAGQQVRVDGDEGGAEIVEESS